MAGSKIGAQMYTIREHTKTPADIEKSCKRLRDIGYEAVQVSAVGKIDVKDLAKILSDNGLTCAATHVGLDMMKDVSQCVEYHQALGCRYTALGGFSGGDDRAAWMGFVDDFNATAAALKSHNIQIGYHNHSHELTPLVGPGPKTPLDLLIQGLTSDIWFEIDTYWIAHGGGDPAAWIDRVKNRIPAVHVKDMTITTKREQKMCEVGSGNLNWPRILDSCKAAGVEWYLVERDSGDLDPFESLAISLKNMKAMGLK